MSKLGGVIAAALAGVVMLAPGAEAKPKTYFANEIADHAPNGCTQQDCTLREAVIAANNHNGPDRVRLRPDATYRIELPGTNEDQAQTGDWDLRGPTTVFTKGERALVFPDNQDRAFDAFRTVTIRNVEVREGLGVVGSALESHTGTATLVRFHAGGNAGSVVHNGGRGQIVLRDSTISGNGSYGVYDEGGGGARVTGSRLTGNVGAAVFVSGPGGIRFEQSVGADTASSAILYDSGPGGIFASRSRFSNIGGEAALDFLNGGITVTRSRITDTAQDAINDFNGGSVSVSRTIIRRTGAEAIAEFNAGKLSATRTQISDAGSDAVNEFNEGSLTFTQSSIDGSGAEGVLEFNEGDVVVRGSRIHDAGDGGAEEFDAGNVIVARSRITSSTGMGVAESGTGGVRASRAVLTGNRGGLETFGGGTSRIASSTIAGNSGSGAGAGLYIQSENTLNLVNSTVSGNESTGNGGGIWVAGRLNAVNSTIAGNEAGNDGAGLFVSGSEASARLNAVTIARNRSTGGDGGGIYLAAPLRMANSIVALNSVPGGSSGRDCLSDPTPVSSAGHNLVSDEDGCLGLTKPSDLTRPQPKLGPLRRNGGPTATLALKAGSPAIGRAGKSSPARDQRGRARDRKPDIGAFER